MISQVVVTYNELEKLIDCIESTKNFADEIIIVDLGQDNRVDSFLSNPKVKIFKHPKVSHVELVRNFAISKAAGEWVLILDPDERIGSKLVEKLKKIANEKKYQAVNIPRKNIFFSKWISHTNFWPDKQIRFFLKKNVKWFEEIHSYPKVSGEIYNLDSKLENAIIHYGYDNYNEFFKRQIRYAKVEAEEKIKKGEGFSIKYLIWMPLREFLVRFVKHKAFLDGLNGLFLVLALMYYRVLVQFYILKKVK